MDQIELAKPRRAGRGRPFVRGQSGNPAGRPPGARNRKTLAAAVFLDGEAEAPTRKAVELALAGDLTALRLCLERILPPCRERTVKLALPPLESADDITAAMTVVAAPLVDGIITPGEGEAIARFLDTFVPVIDANNFARRFTAIERAAAAEADDCC
jgi:Family of unknown function (DUF5681)